MQIFLEVQLDGYWLAKFGMDSAGNELALVSMEHPRSFVSITGGPTLLIGYSTVHTSNFCVVTQWLINHPKFQKNPIYISGDLYTHGLSSVPTRKCVCREPRVYRHCNKGTKNCHCEIHLSLFKIWRIHLDYGHEIVFKALQ